MSLQSEAIADLDALELAQQGSRHNPIIAYPHEHIKVPGVATKWEKTPHKGAKAAKDIARAGVKAIAKAAHNNRGAIVGAATGAIASRLAAGQMLPSRIIGGAVVGHLLHRRSKKRKAKQKHLAMSLVDEAIADLDALELAVHPMHPKYATVAHNAGMRAVNSTPHNLRKTFMETPAAVKMRKALEYGQGFTNAHSLRYKRLKTAAKLMAKKNAGIGGVIKNAARKHPVAGIAALGVIGAATAGMHIHSIAKAARKSRMMLNN